MSPSKFCDHGSARRWEIHPSPLKINKESHLIHKSPSSYSSSDSSSSCNISSSSSSSSYHVASDALVTTMAEVKRQQKQPAIIYMQSPKVIHARASDFMMLVQKLTGYSQSDEDEIGWPQPENVDNDQKEIALDEKESSPSPPLQINLDNCRATDASPPSLYLMDVPLFTPNSTNLFLSQHSRPYVLPDAGNSISASFLEFMKQLPEF